MIENSEPAEAIALKEMLRQKIKRNIEKTENERKLKEMVEKKKIMPKLKEITEQPSIKEKFRNIKKIKSYRISKGINSYKIPSTISDIMPVPSAEVIDIGKLNPFVTDPTVRLIECNGAEKIIVVKRIRGETRTTNIKLNEDEIIGVIKEFSERARIPIEKGIFKAAVGKLIISAIISDFVGSKFLITKIPEKDYYSR
jgi:hypothetical protein